MITALKMKTTTSKLHIIVSKGTGYNGMKSTRVLINTFQNA